MLAVLVNLIAAGGIGVPAVALGLWVALAVGLNLKMVSGNRTIALKGFEFAVTSQDARE